VGLAHRGAQPARLTTAQPTRFVSPRPRAGEASPPSVPAACRQNLAGRRLVGDGGVAGE
jgi:hypothetical protein